VLRGSESPPYNARPLQIDFSSHVPATTCDVYSERYVAVYIRNSHPSPSSSPLRTTDTAHQSGYRSVTKNRVWLLLSDKEQDVNVGKHRVGRQQSAV